ncbi:hypothetical protein HMPREF3188_01414 [Tissierellia bacterium KA00581]|nr:hypothetical protein HMPREF3188_01414 [Tissierellia bacterium KA00581]
MNLIVALIISGRFFYLIANKLKKYSVAFYVAFYAMILAMISINALGYYKKLSPIAKFFVDVVQRGALSTAIFTIVMFTGVFTRPNVVSKRFFKIRGEMSIIGCFMTLTHNIIFGVVYFVNFFKRPNFMPLKIQMAAILSMILIAIMLPLFITSFKCVKKKMKAKVWKRIQRLAYPFYILIYVHVMLLFSMNVEKNKLSILVYTFVYVCYVVLRLRKYILSKLNRKKNKLQLES